MEVGFGYELRWVISLEVLNHVFVLCREMLLEEGMLVSISFVACVLRYGSFFSLIDGLWLF